MRDWHCKVSWWNGELHTDGLEATEVLDSTLSRSSSSNNLKERHCLYFESPLITTHVKVFRSGKMERRKYCSASWSLLLTNFYFYFDVLCKTSSTWSFPFRFLCVLLKLLRASFLISLSRHFSFNQCLTSINFIGIGLQFFSIFYVKTAGRISSFQIWLQKS